MLWLTDIQSYQLVWLAFFFFFWTVVFKMCCIRHIVHFLVLLRTHCFYLSSIRHSDTTTRYDTHTQTLWTHTVFIDIRNWCNIDDTTVCTLESQSLIILVNSIDFCGTRQPLCWITISAEVKVHLLQQDLKQIQAISRTFETRPKKKEGGTLGKKKNQYV